MSAPLPDRAPVVLLEEIFPGDTNPYGTAFGGRILALMDRAAGLAASRFAHAHFVTASMDAVRFEGPVRQGEIAEVSARVVYASRRTVGVEATVSAMDKTRWARRPCCRGLVFMVSMSEAGETLPVPSFRPETEEEQAAWARAEAAHRRLR